MTVTYVDADVLMSAFMGVEDAARRAIAVLDDPERSFISSVLVQLETLPQPTRNKRAAEVAFYREFFNSCARMVDVTPAVCAKALDESLRHGLTAMDGLHVAAAATGGADQLVTGEKETKPIHRTTLINVVRM